ncbi:UNVERIFIED_ORG: cell wall-active antibiotic response 4TMS protein YvqF [Actinomadura viridilutea]
MHRVCDDGDVNLPEHSSSTDPAPSPSAAERSDPARPPASGPAPGDAAADPALLRASDADRDRVADLLREALAEGRITPEEHAERIDAVYRAKTYAELTPLVSDIPGAAEQAPLPPEASRPRVSLRKEAAAPNLPPPERQPTSLVAIFSGAQRRGRWLVEPTTNVNCVFGGVELDFRKAVLSQAEVTVNVSCLFGGVEVVVPPGVRVTNSVSAVFGGVELPDDDPLEPDAPVVRLTGFLLFGGVRVQRRALDGTGDRRHEGRDEVRERLREHRREIREHRRELREHRRELREAHRRGRRDL